VNVGLESYWDLYAKFSILEHETDYTIEIMVHVGGILHRQLATGEILGLKRKKLARRTGVDVTCCAIWNSTTGRVDWTPGRNASKQGIFVFTAFGGSEIDGRRGVGVIGCRRRGVPFQGRIELRNRIPIVVTATWQGVPESRPS
jgi:hypothetical protein